MIKIVTTKNFDEFWQGFLCATNTRPECLTLEYPTEEQFKHEKLRFDTDAFDERIITGDSPAFAQGFGHAVLYAQEHPEEVTLQANEPGLPCLQWAGVI